MNPRILYSVGLLLLLSIFIHFSCQKEISSTNPAPPTPPVIPVIENINTNISGRVTDENNLPVKNASIKAGSHTVTTDINGEFQASNVLVEKNAAFVKVEKQGYFTGSRTFIARANANHYIEIELVPKKLTGSFSASSGGTINIANGGSINFEPSSIKNAVTNAPYSGNVEVAAYFINPAAPNFSRIMPGDLRGLNLANDERALQSYGMMVVELTGTGGETLNIAANKTAVLNSPIPSSMLGHAPATIPLWHFDEVKGLWKEEGSATKQGNSYVGSVSHFSTWNFDVPYPLINFEATIHDGAGKPVPNTKVLIRIIDDATPGAGSGYTDVSGKVWGKVPANKNLQLVVYNKCEVEIHSQNIGPYSSDKNLGIVTVNNSTSNFIFSGTVQDCTNAPVANGFVNIRIGNLNYHTAISNGNYSHSVKVCAGITQAELTATDLGSNQQSTKTTVPITANTATSNLKACGTSITQFINYTLNGTNYALVVPGDSLIAFRTSQGTISTSINGMSLTSNPEQYIDFNIRGGAMGTFPLNSVRVSLNNKSYYLSGSSNAAFTEYGAVNEFVAGNFSATLADSTSTFPFSCNFRVRRVQ